MTLYGQFCPISKATEIIGEKWTLLILRELLLGTSRFNDFQRAMSRISPTVLNKRLKQLEANGIVIKKRLSGQKGHEYRLTPMGKELEPLIEQIAIWGQRWARGQMSDDELDVELLMWDVHRRIQVERLPDGETVLAFHFNDLARYQKWWLVVSGPEVDLCTEDPGKDVDLYISCNLRTMVDVWMGGSELDVALAAADAADAATDAPGAIVAVGDKALRRTMKDWFGLSKFADTKAVQ